MENIFDSLKFYEELKAANVPEKQARAHAEALRAALAAYDGSRLKEMATKGDLRETELRLQAEIEKIRTEIKNAEIRLLKWQIGAWLTLAAIMAKGFGWLGF